MREQTPYERTLDKTFQTSKICMRVTIAIPKIEDLTTADITYLKTMVRSFIVWLTHILVIIECCAAFTVQNSAVTTEVSIPTLVVVGCISCVVLVLVLALCGGCTPMEVGSDQHQAAGGNRSNMESPYYTMGTTNVNTRVLTSSTNVGNDPYQPEDNSGLPYPVRPQTDNNFVGYQQLGYQQQGYQQGYQQQQGHQSQQSNQQQYGYQQQTNIPGANRHVMDESEPPPPSYNEALSTAGNQRNPTAPSYGW